MPLQKEMQLSYSAKLLFYVSHSSLESFPSTHLQKRKARILFCLVFKHSVTENFLFLLDLSVFADKIEASRLTVEQHRLLM